MDAPGLLPSGIASSPAAKAVRPMTSGDLAKGAGFVVEEKALRRKAPTTMDERTIGVFRGIQSATSSLWFVQLIATLPLAGLASLFGFFGWNSASNGIRHWFIAPVQALFTTSVAETWQLPANSVIEARTMAEAAGKPTDALNARLPGWEEWGTKMRARVAAFFKPMRDAVGSWLDGFSKDGWIVKRLQSFTQWRVNRHAPKVGAAVDATHGFLDAIMQAPEKLGQTGKATAAEIQQATRLKEIFTPVFELLEQAKQLTGSERTAVLKRAQEMTLALIKQHGLSGAEAAIVHQLTTLVSSAYQSAKTLLGHEGALAQGVRGMVKNIGRIAGRIPLFYAIVGTGVVAGGIASMLSARHENRMAKRALKEMKEELGDAEHPIIRQASKIETTHRGRRWMSAGLNTASEAAYLVPATSAVGGMLVFGLGSSLPQVSQAITPENQVLGAYMALKQAEQGKVKLMPEQRAQLVGHLVAAVPAVTQNGGLHNRLVEPISVELVKRNLSTRELLQFIANPEKFTALTKDIAAQVKKADEAARAAEPKQAAESKSNANSAVSDKPHASIAAAKGTSQGRVLEAQRAVGQV